MTPVSQRNEFASMQQPDQHSLDPSQQRWLQPLGPVHSATHRSLYGLGWSFVHAGFRFRVEGGEVLSSISGPVIFAPNHESSLDAPLLAAALPYSTLRQTHWAGRRDRLLSNPLMRFFSRAAQVLPIDRNFTAVIAGAAVLRRQRNLVWFPEGTRTRDGRLQEFKAGVGTLARRCDVPVVPVCIQGAYEALPPGRGLPRFFSTIVVRFGEPILPDQIDRFEPADTAEPTDGDQRIADELRDRVQHLDETDEAISGRRTGDE